MAKVIVLCLAVLAAAITGSKALTAEELAKVEGSMLVHVQECAKQFDVSESELKKAKEDEDIDGIDPCLLKCIFNKVKLIDDKGMFDADKAIDYSKELLSDKDDVAKFEEIAHDCSKVNEESVSDGEEGCDRSKFLLMCLAKHKDELKVSS